MISKHCILKRYRDVELLLAIEKEFVWDVDLGDIRPADFDDFVDDLDTFITVWKQARAKKSLEVAA